MYFFLFWDIYYSEFHDFFILNLFYLKKMLLNTKIAQKLPGAKHDLLWVDSWWTFRIFSKPKNWNCLFSGTERSIEGGFLFWKIFDNEEILNHEIFRWRWGPTYILLKRSIEGGFFCKIFNNAEIWKFQIFRGRWDPTFILLKRSIEGGFFFVIFLGYSYFCKQRFGKRKGRALSISASRAVFFNTLLLLLRIIFG